MEARALTRAGHIFRSFVADTAGKSRIVAGYKRASEYSFDLVSIHVYVGKVVPHGPTIGPRLGAAQRLPPVQGRHQGRVLPSKTTKGGCYSARLLLRQLCINPSLSQLRIGRRPVVLHQGDGARRRSLASPRLPRFLLSRRLLRGCKSATTGQSDRREGYCGLGKPGGVTVQVGTQSSPLEVLLRLHNSSGDPRHPRGNRKGALPALPEEAGQDRTWFGSPAALRGAAPSLSEAQGREALCRPG